MQNSVKTSDLLQYRAQHIVPKRMETLTKAILDKDYNTFAEETMKVWLVFYKEIIQSLTNKGQEL